MRAMKRKTGFLTRQSRRAAAQSWRSPGKTLRKARWWFTVSYWSFAMAGGLLVGLVIYFGLGSR